MRRRRLVRKRFLTGCFIMLLFVAILTGRSMLTIYGRRGTCDCQSHITGASRSKTGDNLWNIARQYKKGSRMSTEEYIRELKRMNSLRSDTIHKGQFLTIVYYK